MFRSENEWLKKKKQALNARPGVFTLRGLGPLSLPTHFPPVCVQLSFSYSQNNVGIPAELEPTAVTTDLAGPGDSLDNEIYHLAPTCDAFG